MNKYQQLNYVGTPLVIVFWYKGLENKHTFFREVLW